ncbi:Hsp70 family protein [Thermoactinospora rubra]|uniref:Hsp70 family protein n=1 Tax=Thermoactinospora rubra TaxID=1088767 RepID=UPI000A0FB6B4|nr:Hsp70 family protein [Thermoactinospora rubra]
MAAEHATGIDFGTSTSLVADQVGRLPLEIVPIGHSTTWLPSVAAVFGDTLLVGEEAEDQPANRIIRSAKRAITENRKTLRIGNVEVNADKVIVALLREIARRAEAAGQPLSDAGEVRLGCPAMWTGDQRERLLKLAAEAGFPVTGASLIDEPIAAGVAWATHRFYQPGKRPHGKLLVFDMGGGTLDIAVLDIAGRDQPEISVLSALGSAEAGDTLDRAIVGQLALMLAKRGIVIGDLPNPHLVEALLLNAAREAKIRLTSAESHRVLTRGLDFPELIYTREQLVEAFRPQLDRAEAHIFAALRSAKMTETIPLPDGGTRTHSPEELRRLGPDGLINEIRYVVLVGGMSRIPYVGRRLGALFPKAEVFDTTSVAPEEAIVAGLANTTEYGRLNLHRPGFDFILEWDSGQEVIYRAHTPLYDPWQAFSMSTVYYDWRAAGSGCPRQGVGRLRVRSITGETVKIRINDEPRDHLKIRLGEPAAFRLYCDGRIVITDGRGETGSLRVDRWPVIHSGNFAELVLKRVAPSQGHGREPDWGYLQKEWAPPLPKR